jgi:N6-L-threonylcarbamoyladenine synthase
MLILGIETSCDETAAAIVKDGRAVLSNAIASQIDIHRLTNGVVPEVAARAHVGQLQAVLDEALKVSGVSFNEIDAIAGTEGPGLLTSLIIGASFASTLAWIFQKPLIPVNHIKGHIFSNWLDLEDEIEFPIVVLTVSGGHNELVLMKSVTELEIIGETLDDAAGESYDKVAKMIGLPYPGGPEISKLAPDGNEKAFDFARPMINNDDFDFSFSGLKTSVMYKIRDLKDEALSRKADIAASFQAAVNEVLTVKLLKAAKKFNAKEIHLAGGVSANKNLREMIQGKSNELKFRHPKQISYCTDNAAMIAGAAFFSDKNSWLEAGKAISPKLA